jgi:hypothetical protein
LVILATCSSRQTEPRGDECEAWLTRPAYAFSKKWDNLKAALALNFRALQFL